MGCSCEGCRTKREEWVQKYPWPGKKPDRWMVADHQGRVSLPYRYLSDEEDEFFLLAFHANEHGKCMPLGDLTPEVMAEFREKWAQSSPSSIGVCQQANSPMPRRNLLRRIWEMIAA